MVTRRGGGAQPLASLSGGEPCRIPVANRSSISPAARCWWIGDTYALLSSAPSAQAGPPTASRGSTAAQPPPSAAAPELTRLPRRQAATRGGAMARAFSLPQGQSIYHSNPSSPPAGGAAQERDAGASPSDGHGEAAPVPSADPCERAWLLTDSTRDRPHGPY